LSTTNLIRATKSVHLVIDSNSQYHNCVQYQISKK